MYFMAKQANNIKERRSCSDLWSMTQWQNHTRRLLQQAVMCPVMIQYYIVLLFLYIYIFFLIPIYNNPGLQGWEIRVTISPLSWNCWEVRASRVQVSPPAFNCFNKTRGQVLPRGNYVAETQTTSRQRQRSETCSRTVYTVKYWFKKTVSMSRMCISTNTQQPFQ